MDEQDLAARTLVNAIEAGQRVDVRTFRMNAVGDRLLNKWECVDWIEEWHRAEPPEFFPDGSIRYLCYAGPYGWHYESVGTRPGGQLEELRSLSERLAEDFGWAAGAATVFVLTDAIPTDSGMRVTTHAGRPGGDYITLRVPPGLTARQIQRLYSAGAEQLQGRPVRAPRSDKRRRLAIFAAEHKGGPMTLAAARRAWKQANPDDDSMGDPKDFGERLHEAYRQVTGRDLVWWNARSRRRRGSRTARRDLGRTAHARRARDVIREAEERFLEDLRASGLKGPPSQWSEEGRARFEELRRYLPGAPWDKDVRKGLYRPMRSFRSLSEPSKPGTRERRRSRSRGSRYDSRPRT